MSDRELLEATVFSCKACPACGAAGCCDPHGSYERWMIAIRCGEREECLLAIKRVLCSSCGHTHALLPDILIPYSAYSLRFIVHVLWAYLNKNGTVAELCKGFQISVSTLYAWIYLFEEQANLWLSALEQIPQISIQALEHFKGIGALPFLFFRRYGFSFLQGRRTTHCGYDP